MRTNIQTHWGKNTTYLDNVGRKTGSIKCRQLVQSNHLSASPPSRVTTLARLIVTAEFVPNALLTLWLGSLLSRHCATVLITTWLYAIRRCVCVLRVNTPDNVKFPDGSPYSSTALGMLSVPHIMPVLVLLSVVGIGMQQCMIRNHIFII